MKARDLAALAALGVGGYYLYNRNKGDAAPKGDAMPAAPAPPANMNAGVGRRDAGYAEDTNAGMGRRYASDAEDMNAGVGRRSAGASEITPNAMGVPDTEVYKRSELDDLKGGRMPTRPGQSTSGMVKRPVAAAAGAAPLSSGRKPSVSQAAINTAKRDASMSSYTPRRDPNAAARARLSKGEGDEAGNLKRGGAVKKMASGGSVSSASSRGDGIAQRGKTRGKMC